MTPPTCAASGFIYRSDIIRSFALMSERQPQIVHCQARIDTEDAQRFRAGVEVLMPLKHRDREHVEGIEIVLGVFDDHFTLATDDEIDLVVEMAMRARAFARRNLSHHHTQSFGVETDTGVDHVSQIPHGSRLEIQISLLDQSLAGAAQLLFMHGEGDLFGVKLGGSVAVYV